MGRGPGRGLKEGKIGEDSEMGRREQNMSSGQDMRRQQDAGRRQDMRKNGDGS